MKAAMIIEKWQFEINWTICSHQFNGWRHKTQRKRKI